MLQVRTYLKQHKSTAIELLIIALLGLTPLLWFKGKALAGGDIPLHTLPLTMLRRTFFVWNDSMYLGDVSFMPSTFPYLAFLSFWSLWGLSAVAVEKLWYCSMLTGTGLAMYYLASMINRSGKQVNALVAAFFFMFNLTTLVSFGTLENAPILNYAICPLLLGLFYQGFRQRSYRYAYLVALVSFFVTVTHPPTFLMLWGAILLYILYELVLDKQGKGFILRFSLIAFLLSALVNLHRTIPYVVLLSNIRQTFIGAYTFPAVLRMNTSSSTMVNVIRLIYYRTWVDNQVPYFSIGQMYHSSHVLIFLTFTLSILTLLAIVLGRRRDILFFALLSLLGLFLAKGPNPPLGEVFSYLYEHLPGFTMFRMPGDKGLFWTSIGYAILLGHVSHRLQEYVRSRPLTRRVFWRERSPLLLNLVLLLLISGVSWPMFTGDLIPVANEQYPVSFRVVIPDYWPQSADYVNSSLDKGRIFLLPRNPFYQNHYGWGYHGIDLPQFMYRIPLVSVEPDGGDLGGYAKNRISVQFIEDIYAIPFLHDSAGMEAALSLSNTAYVVHRKDLDWTFYGFRDPAWGAPDEVEEYLTSLSYLKYERYFGELDFYRYESVSRLPQIWGARDVIVSDDELMAKLRVLEEIELPEQLWVYRGDLQPAVKDNPDMARRVVLETRASYEPLALLDGTADGGWQVENQAMSAPSTVQTSEDEVKEGNHFLLWTLRTTTPGEQWKYSVIRNLGSSDLSRYDGVSFWLHTDAPQIEVNFVLDEDGTGAGVGHYAMYFTQLEPNQWNHIIIRKSELRYVNHNERIPAFTNEEWRRVKRIRLLECILPECGQAESNRTYTFHISDMVGIAYSLAHLGASGGSEPLPEITFAKIDPTSYHAYVEGATEPYFLVLSESFYPGWQASINGQKVDERRHLLVNGYANAWWIDEKGDYEVVINFLPQTFFNIGLAVSSVTLLCCGYLLYRTRG